MIDAEKREALRIAKAAVKVLERPEREARKIAAAKARRERNKRVGKLEAGQRQPRVRDNAFLAFVRRKPCMKCGTTQRVEAAHVRSGYPEAGWRSTGMQEKPDDCRTLPLCATCHREGPKAQHGGNERAWWEALGIYPPAACAALYEEFSR